MPAKGGLRKSPERFWLEILFRDKKRPRWEVTASLYWVRDRGEEYWREPVCQDVKQGWDQILIVRDRQVSTGSTDRQPELWGRWDLSTGPVWPACCWQLFLLFSLLLVKKVKNKMGKKSHKSQNIMLMIMFLFMCFVTLDRAVYVNSTSSSASTHWVQHVESLYSYSSPGWTNHTLAAESSLLQTLKARRTDDMTLVYSEWRPLCVAFPF